MSVKGETRRKKKNRFGRRAQMIANKQSNQGASKKQARQKEWSQKSALKVRT